MSFLVHTFAKVYHEYIMCVPKSSDIMIKIKKSISAYLQKVYGRATTESQIRIRVRWSEGVYQFNSGFTIDPTKWNSEQGTCKRNASNKKGYSASYINKEVQRLEDAAEEVFQTFEVLDEVPTVEAFKTALNKSLGRVTKEDEQKAKPTLQKVFREYISAMSKYKSWSDSTIAKHNSLMRLLNDFDRDLKIEDVSRTTLEKYLDFLYSRDLQNTTIKRNLKFVRTFLKWANEKEYLKSEEWRGFNPELKTVNHKQIVFLSWEELMRLYNFEFPENKNYLAHARDIFCFQCFTSLRYSDVSTLKPTDCFDDYIMVTTEKTDTSLKIELNKYSKAILQKYLSSADGGFVFRLSNQRMNEYIKECCYLAGINEPITHIYYKGAERMEETLPKYELIGSHTARRTFVCNALSLGIDPTTVMSWTGHSDYKSLKPYISAVDEVKKKSMALFDEL